MLIRLKNEKGNEFNVLSGENKDFRFEILFISLRGCVRLVVILKFHYAK